MSEMNGRRLYIPTSFIYQYCDVEIPALYCLVEMRPWLLHSMTSGINSGSQLPLSITSANPTLSTSSPTSKSNSLRTDELLPNSSFFRTRVVSPSLYPVPKYFTSHIERHHGPQSQPNHKRPSRIIPPNISVETPHSLQSPNPSRLNLPSNPPRRPVVRLFSSPKTQTHQAHSHPLP